MQNIPSLVDTKAGTSVVATRAGSLSQLTEVEEEQGYTDFGRSNTFFFSQPEL